MNILGVGPVFVSLSAAYAVGMLLISATFQPLFRIDILPDWLCLVVGASLVVVGLLSLRASVRAIWVAHGADQLVTTGVYGWCRHPLYASWLLGIVPGIVLMLDSWLVLTTPLFMYGVLRLLVQREEVYLETLFGERYRNYKAATPWLLPCGKVKRRADTE